MLYLTSYIYACHDHKLSSSATCDANVSVLAMLEWFVSKSDVDHAMNEGTLLNDDIKCRPEKLPCTCVDENVTYLESENILQMLHGIEC